MLQGILYHHVYIKKLVYCCPFTKYQVPMFNETLNTITALLTKRHVYFLLYLITFQMLRYIDFWKHTSEIMLLEYIPCWYFFLSQSSLASLNSACFLSRNLPFVIFYPVFSKDWRPQMWIRGTFHLKFDNIILISWVVRGKMGSLAGQKTGIRKLLNQHLLRQGGPFKKFEARERLDLWSPIP